MNEDTDQLSETFVAHEHLAPDSALVLEKANGIARSYQRRRWAVRATGGAVLGAGLVVGGIALPGRAWHSTSGGATSLRAASGADPSPSASPATYTTAQELSAYFAGGYDYNNAVQLAQFWHDGSDIARVKADAGLKLLQGETLPVTPNGQPETPADRAESAFFAAGYDYNDAVSLGKLWHETDITTIKTEAGQKLMDGQTLPIQPSGPTATVLSQPNAAVSAFFDAGYDYNDAVSLGNLWHETNTYKVKAEAGQKLLDGKTLPIAPSGQPASPADKAQAEYFAAGYDYSDAVKLGKIWHETDITKIKAEAGQKLLKGEKLPIAP